MEPFQKKGLIDRYRRRLNMETAYANINGQIWLFFDAVVEWELVEDTEQQVTVRVFHHDLGQHMMMTFFYANCSAMERLELWDHLYYLESDMELPWLVGGDFNVVLHEDEKIGGLSVHPPEYEDLAFCVNSCGLLEQGYKGSPFTWWNGISNAECIFKRLDRNFVNFPFQNMLPTIKVEHLIRTGSDHAPLLMTCGVQTTNFVKPFRFLNFRTKHATFMDVVRQNWEADFIGDPLLMFKKNIKRVKATLSKWSRKTFGDIFKQLAILEEIVRFKEMLFEEEPTTENRIVLQKAQSELKKYLSIEEQYWKQKVGMTWFAEEDRNTSFFHNHVNGKRTKLQLKKIKSGSGFTNEGDASEFSLLNNVPSMVTVDQKLELSRLPTIEEDVIGADIHNMVLHFYGGAALPKSITHTNLVLLPKKPRVETFSDLRPISLSKFINKSSGFFKSTRGVKQGDPLSPALFILSAEEYADDTIIFASDYPPSLRKIMAVLGNYEKLSGQMINKDKSSYYMHSKVANGLFQVVGSITGFARGKFPFTYLGCPIFYTIRRKDYYEYLIKKVKAKLHSWKGKLLSFGGKATLISSVLQSMPVHMLSVLDPPNNILEHLHKTFARFFWSTKKEGRSRHWASWQNLCLPKEEGGLGFRSLHDVSRALFAKLWWKFRTTKSLWSNFMWNKYCKKELPTMTFQSIKIFRRWQNCGKGEAWNDQLLDQTFSEEIAEHIRLNVNYEGSEGYWDRPY
ncbi:uncharacterized protein LOC142169569 [Nicotiana tabacum]|uniref:Uncharacterized protein LOC142169569 n=1 Tax=Nicotiana tabacum TaxID=4097 RepID=A0AC58SRE4_TOBAC